MNSLPTTDKKQRPQQRLLAAARKLFFAHGYQGVSTDMLAREAGISKSTLYKLYADKPALFAAVINAESERFHVDETYLPEDRETCRSALIDFGLKLLELLSDPDIIRFEQLMLSQARDHPQTAELFL